MYIKLTHIFNSHTDQEIRPVQMVHVQVDYVKQTKE